MNIIHELHKSGGCLHTMFHFRLIRVQMIMSKHVQFDVSHRSKGHETTNIGIHEYHYQGEAIAINTLHPILLGRQLWKYLSAWVQIP